MQYQNMTFGEIPTTCFRAERPSFFHNGVKPKETDQPFDAFLRKLRTTVRNDRFTFVYNGVPVMAHPKWIRDHVYEMKGYKHWETDLKKYLEIIVENQSSEGFFYEMVQLDSDYHTTVVDGSCKKKIEGQGLTLVRLDVEADVEFLVVEGVYTVYTSTGDTAWLRRMLPGLERAVEYCTSSPKRWDSAHGLMKRPYTIDTWDFAYDISASHRMIASDSRMCIMHGDNTGLYQAMMQLSVMCRAVGADDRALSWQSHARQLKERLDRYCWNGRFYTHQIPLNCTAVDTHEKERLSLSNAYAMTRGAVTDEQAQAILSEYQLRRETAGAFAEWFSIDPPYEETFNGHPKNTYVNGGIASLTAGELAHAAFLYGREAYGWDIIQRLMRLVERDGELHFLYDPETGADLGGGPSGWGAAAIIDAIDDGLAGIRNGGICYDTLYFSPKWAITDMKQVKYITGLALSHTFIESYFVLQEDGIKIQLACPSDRIVCHILLPKEIRQVQSVTCDGKTAAYTLSAQNDSVYVDFLLKGHGRSTDLTEYPEQVSLNIEIRF